MGGKNSKSKKSARQQIASLLHLGDSEEKDAGLSPTQALLLGSGDDKVCKGHQLLQHDIFISYRVQSDATLAKFVAYYLQLQERDDNRPVTVYLDKTCLNDGEPWEEGFLAGLRGSALIILLISEEGLKRVEGSDKVQDNCLLEYELALAKQANGSCLVLPLLVGSYTEDNLYKKFGSFDTDRYPDAPHASENSDLNVRETMKSLFSLQGIAIDPNNYEDKMGGVMDKLNEALTTLGRIDTDTPQVVLGYSKRDQDLVKQFRTFLEARGAVVRVVDAENEPSIQDCTWLNNCLVFVLLCTPHLQKKMHPTLSGAIGLSFLSDKNIISVNMPGVETAVEEEEKFETDARKKFDHGAVTLSDFILQHFGDSINETPECKTPQEFFAAAHKMLASSLETNGSDEQQHSRQPSRQKDSRIQEQEQKKKAHSVCVYDFWQASFQDQKQVSVEAFSEAFSLRYSEDFKDSGKVLMRLGDKKLKCGHEEVLFVLLEFVLHWGDINVVTHADYLELLGNRAQTFNQETWEQDPFRHVALDAFVTYCTVTLLMDSECFPEMRIAAVDSLRMQSNESFDLVSIMLETLLRYAQDGDANDRTVAFLTIGKVNKETPAVMDACLRGLSDKDRMVRQAAIIALSKIGSSQSKVVDGIMDLWRNDPISNVRAAAEVAMAVMGKQADGRKAMNLKVTALLAESMEGLKTLLTKPRIPNVVVEPEIKQQLEDASCDLLTEEVVDGVQCLCFSYQETAVPYGSDVKETLTAHARVELADAKKSSVTCVLDMTPITKDGINFAGKWVVCDAEQGSHQSPRTILIPGVNTYDIAGRTGDPHASERLGKSCAEQILRVSKAMLNVALRHATAGSVDAVAASMEDIVHKFHGREAMNGWMKRQIVDAVVRLVQPPSYPDYVRECVNKGRTHLKGHESAHTRAYLESYSKGVPWPPAAYFETMAAFKI